jgi:hypothetical protein
MKHTLIRQKIIDVLEEAIGIDVMFFDGRPAVIEEDFPAVAVYLTDAEYTGEELDADMWRQRYISRSSCPRRYQIPNWMNGWKAISIRPSLMFPASIHC